MPFVRVARAGDIPPGTGRQIEAQGARVAVFNVDGAFHAMEGTCLHRGGPVGEGDLEGRVVTCPWHGWQYDVTTGKVTFDDEVGLPSYRVRVVDGSVEVNLPE